MLFRKNRSPSTRTHPVGGAGSSSAMMEGLENRRLMSVSLTGGTVLAQPVRIVSTSSVSIGTGSVTSKYTFDQVMESNGNFPPGQFPSGNPAQSPGQSNPNEIPEPPPPPPPPPQ